MLVVDLHGRLANYLSRCSESATPFRKGSPAWLGHRLPQHSLLEHRAHQFGHCAVAIIAGQPCKHVAYDLIHKPGGKLGPQARQLTFGCSFKGSRGQLGSLDPLRQPDWALAATAPISTISASLPANLPAVIDVLRHSLTMDLGLTCMWLFFGALAAGSLPLLFTVSESQLALAAALSAGLLIGAACSVVVPEGFESFHTAVGESRWSTLNCIDTKAIRFDSCCTLSRADYKSRSGCRGRGQWCAQRRHWRCAAAGLPGHVAA